MVCSRCSFANRADANFCQNCGYQLRNAAVSHSDDPPSPGQAPPIERTNDRAPLRRPQKSAEQRVITILMSDVVDSTSIAEQVGPEAWTEIMNKAFECMTEPVHRYEGTVARLMGDGILAFFGAPLALENAPLRATLAGLAIVDAIRPLRERLSREHSLNFNVRAGINTGPVVVGDVGTERALEYTAMGDAVNLASRMEQLAAPGSVYLAAPTERAVREHVHLEYIGALTVKGKKEPQETYRAIEPKVPPTETWSDKATGIVQFVGRARELALLRSYFDGAKDSKGQVVLVSGDAGIGKSRMVLEFLRTVRDEDALWLEGQCVPFQRQTPYLPFVDIVKQSFAIQKADNEAQIIRQVVAETSSWDPELKDTVAYLRFLLSVEPGDSQVSIMDPQARRAGVLLGLKALLAQKCREQPLIVVVEDLHWIDEQSAAALHTIVDAVAGLPMILLLSFRSGYEQPFESRDHVSHLRLRELGERESAEVVRSILGASRVPDEVSEFVRTKGAGNPFYIEQITRSLLEERYLEHLDGSYRLTKPPESIEIPDTIQAVILSRIDRLSQETRETLQLASVIGREFSILLLEQISELGERLGSVLDELVYLELVYRNSDLSEHTYVFKHALTQDVAYSTLLQRRRRTLHRLIAEATERIYASRLSERYEVLAYHFDEAEEREKSLVYLVKAGNKAASAYANEEARSHFARALLVCELLGDQGLATAAEVTLARGMLSFSVTDFPGAISDFEAMRVAARRLRDRRNEAVALAYRGWAEWWNHEFENAEATCKSAIEVAAGDFDDVHFFASSTIGLGLYGINRLAEAQPYLESAQALAPDVSDLFAQSWWSVVGWHQRQWEGRFDETLEHLSRWRGSIEKTGSVFLLLGDRWLESVTRASKGDYTRALELLDDVMRTGDRVGGVAFWQ